jgi:hypothetical protein
MAEGRFIAYLRVSTTKQGKSGLGLEAQRKATGHCSGARGARHSHSPRRQVVICAGGAIAGGCQPFRGKRRARHRVEKVTKPPRR